MSQTYHAVVWIDHREARVFHFGRESAERIVIHPDHPSHHLHHKANSIGSGKSGEDHEFLHAVAEALVGSEAILITGPGSAKTELVKHIEAHDKAIAPKIVAVETVDHPTDKELVAHARSRFSFDHEVKPRVS
eukprot:gene21096-21875_t